ncbi:MAG TPA: SURF1 family protein [Thiobacillus sp.]|nr:MAG: hypothetical protein B7Y50_05195 [Hydrogenophilales bacterium 28-61-11]OYZ58470.1 MAG: hypothetical protein B7Y21_03115 [Hydrogenophilales bacterium 16-61-112]OZA49323.1 MAG: hypothetical protein B7X81_02580 [Hydrogenophilales bacterium 17-61-76]HQT31868.1 SURF1 family protein [Thiobacillus sp.]HQT69696.1 SURF1 family protein [Thiobacillus sp.]
MHKLSLRVGAWRFTPGLWPSLAALLFFVLTLWLGNWQSERAASKRTLQAQYDAAVHDSPIHVGKTLLNPEELLYRKLEVQGIFDDRNTIFLDNKVHEGVAGYHVLTPLRIEGGPISLLVDRGWVASGPSRQQLPPVSTPAARVKLEGMAIDPHSRYLELSNAEPRGRVWQNLDFERYAAESGLTLQPILLLQTSPFRDGLKRNWPRPDTGVSMHLGYAFQWYSLATTLVVLWVVMNVKRDREKPASLLE